MLTYFFFARDRPALSTIPVDLVAAPILDVPKTIALPELFQERVPSSSRCFSTLVLMLANISRRASLPSRAPDHIAQPFRVG